MAIGALALSREKAIRDFISTIATGGGGGGGSDSLGRHSGGVGENDEEGDGRGARARCEGFGPLLRGVESVAAVSMLDDT